jgi:hypothetical protein
VLAIGRLDTQSAREIGSGSLKDRAFSSASGAVILMARLWSIKQSILAAAAKIGGQYREKAIAEK